MPKKEREESFLAYVEKFLYTSLYAIVSFFIYVGEGTKFIFFAPFKILELLHKFISSFFNRSFNFFKAGFNTIRTSYQKLIVAFRNITDKLKFPSFKFTWPVRLPKVRTARPRRIPVFSFKIRYFIFGFSASLVIVFVYNSYVFVKSLPSPKTIGKVNYPLSTHIYDRNGKLLYEFYREQNRTPVKLTTLPSYITRATIAIEDKDFFKHNGISPIGGIIRALKENIFNKKFQGGSTITQQLVKSALLTPERTIQRKFKEIILALWTERIFTKEEILEMYLNQVPYGGASYGIEEAAKTYFKKSAKELNISEAAFLAGLPQAPSLYSPFINPTLALRRRNEVLKEMLELKYINEQQYKQAKEIDLEIASPKTAIRAPHFVFFVKNELINRFGIRTVEEGGLRVITSLDLNLQEQAEEMLKEELEKIKNLNVTNGAILITNPKTGEILAMVGSVDYFDGNSGAFNVTTALRQPGSSIKPLMYSLALERDYTAATPIDDTPVVFPNPGSVPYKPVNYDGKFHGRLPLRYVLANSFNVPAVKTLNTLGVNDFVEHARKLGISTWTDPSRFGLSLTLGGGEVSMVDMAKAFGTFASLGERKNISPIIKITDVLGDTIYENDPQPRQVLSPGVSYIISDILSDNQARTMAFGSRSALEIPGYKVAVKTGTTDDKKDNWTIGYTPEYLAVVWVGNNNNTPMHPYLTSGITGAAPIWNKVMTYLLTHNGSHNTWLSQPSDLVEKNCYGNKVEYFVRGTENKVSCARINLTPVPTKAPN